MRTTYDETVDALYIELRPKAKSARTANVTDDVRVDLDRDGRAIGLEVLNASWHIGPSVRELSSARVELSLAEASKRSGRSPETLRGQIHKGKLKGRKRGPDWVVSAADLENYMEAVESGRVVQPVPRSAKKKARA